MWVKVNPNPAKKNVPDCVIQAICIALNLPWTLVSRELNDLATREFSVTCDDNVWGKYLWQLGFTPFVIPYNTGMGFTIREFARIFNRGTYIIGTGNHAVAVINGRYYDSWDSGDEWCSFYWQIQ